MNESLALTEAATRNQAKSLFYLLTCLTSDKLSYISLSTHLSFQASLTAILSFALVFSLSFFPPSPPHLQLLPVLLA